MENEKNNSNSEHRCKFNQHYVFQSYLKAWTDDRNELWEYKRGRQKIVHKGTTNTLSAYKTYELKDMNDDELKFFELFMDSLKISKSNKKLLWDHITAYLMPFRNKDMINLLKTYISVPMEHPAYNELKSTYDNLCLSIQEAIVNTDEDFFGDYEKDGKEWFARILNGDLNFYYPELYDVEENHDYTERDEFITFVCIQYFRTLEMRGILIRNIQNMIDLSERIKGYEFDRTNVRAEHILPQASWVFFNILSTAFISRNAHLTVLKNNTTVPFITSDQPVINLKYEKNKNPEEFVIYYPITPKVAITINDENRHFSKEIDSKSVIDDYNHKMVDHFNTYLIGNSKEILSGIVDMYL